MSRIHLPWNLKIPLNYQLLINSWHTLWGSNYHENLSGLRRHLVVLKMFKYNLEQYCVPITLLSEPSISRYQEFWAHFLHFMNYNGFS